MGGSSRDMNQSKASSDVTSQSGSLLNKFNFGPDNGKVNQYQSFSQMLGGNGNLGGSSIKPDYKRNTL